MEFEPKTWVGGDTVTAAHLNRIEQGIVEAGQSGGESGNIFWCNGVPETNGIDKSYNEITEAVANGMMVMFRDDWTTLEELRETSAEYLPAYLSSVRKVQGGYLVEFSDFYDNQRRFFSETATDPMGDGNEWST